MERTIAKSGEKGLAQVSIGKKYVEVVYENEKRFKVGTDMIPEFMLGSKFPTSGKFFVKLGRDNDEIVSISPVEGTYQVKFAKFSARQGEDPTPLKQKSSFNDSFYFTFMAVLRVTRGALRGCEIAVFLPYRFTEGDGGEAVYIGSDKENATGVRKLEQFLEVTGLLDKRIRFTDNLLPKFQRLALEMDKEFNVSLRNGKLEYFAAIPAVDEDEDEKPARRKVVDDDEDEGLSRATGYSDDKPRRKTAQVTDEAEDSVPWEDEDEKPSKSGKKAKRTREDEAFDDDEIPF